MKFISVKKLSGYQPTDEMINSFLQAKCGLRNDYVMNSTFIDVKLQLTKLSECIGFVYRLYYEGTLLERPVESRSYIVDINKNIVNIKLSLVEAMKYITDVTPPMFKESTHASIKSIDDIMSMVNYYLSNTEVGEYSYYVSLFFKDISMTNFETLWTYDDNRFKELGTTTNDCMTVVIDHLSRPSENELYFQCSVKTNLFSKDDILNMFRFIDKNRVVNVFKPEKEKVLYFQIYRDK